MKDGRCYECSFVFDVFVIQYLRVSLSERKNLFRDIQNIRLRIKEALHDQVRLVVPADILSSDVGFLRRIISGIEGHSFNFKRNTVLVADLIA